MLKKTLILSAVLTAISLPATAGDPVPGVDVLLEQIPGGAVFTANTDVNGNIIFDNLPPGKYRVYQEVEKPSINVAGPATFTPSDGDDIGTLVVTGTQPIMINKIVARPLSSKKLDRAVGAMTAEDLNSIRSNDGGIVAKPLDPAAILKRMQNGKIKTQGIIIQAAPKAVAKIKSKEDATPKTAKDLKSGRSNDGG